MTGYSGGLNLLTNEVIGLGNNSLAFIYTIVVSALLLMSGQYKLPKDPISFWFKLFLVFFVLDILFSLSYYNFNISQIWRTSRDFLLILSFPILITIKPNDLRRVIYLLFIITFIASILYIFQVILGTPLMPYAQEVSTDISTGLSRFYNDPPLLDFFLLLTFALIVDQKLYSYLCVLGCVKC